MPRSCWRGFRIGMPTLAENLHVSLLRMFSFLSAVQNIAADEQGHLTMCLYLYTQHRFYSTGSPFLSYCRMIQVPPPKENLGDTWNNFYRPQPPHAISVVQPDSVKAAKENRITDYNQRELPHWPCPFLIHKQTPGFQVAVAK